MRQCIRRSSGLSTFHGTALTSTRRGGFTLRKAKGVTPVVAARPKSKPEVGGDDEKQRKRAEVAKKLLEDINKTYGRGTALKFTDAPQDVPMCSTGLLTLDFVLGGGMPIGRIIELYGAEGSGKTTLAWHLVAEIQKPNNEVYYFDMENAFHHKYALKIGVNPDNLVLVQSCSGDTAFNVMIQAIRSRVVSGICVDSVAAMTPDDDLVSGVDDPRVATHARLMSRGMKLVSNAIRFDEDPDNMCTMILINQVRMRVNMMYGYGNPEVRPGGKALPHHAHQALEVRQGKKIEDAAGRHIGHKIKIKTSKNKIFAPYRTTELDLIYGQGICRMGSLLDGALMMDIVSRTGHYYKFGDERIGHGRAKAVERLKAEPELAKKIEELAHAEFMRRCTDGEDVPDSMVISNVSSLPVNGLSKTAEEEEEEEEVEPEPEPVVPEDL